MSDPSSTPKSCLTCHSYLQPGEEPARKSALAKHFATNCPSHGEPLPPLPIEQRLQVVMPDLDTRDTSDRTAVEQDNCVSCAMCKNFVRDDIVADELGWTAGLCAAKGKLILAHRQTYEARECEYRWWGPIRPSTGGLHLLPEYEDAFQATVNPVA